jgi:hypothetical protein
MEDRGGVEVGGPARGVWRIAVIVACLDVKQCSTEPKFTRLRSASPRPPPQARGNVPSNS